MRSGLRVTILGGGSAYTPGLIEGFIRQKNRIPIEKLVLMDIDAEKLVVNGSLVSAMLAVEMPGTEIITTLDRLAAIQGADFILCQIRVGGLAARHLDESIPIEMGLIGQETTGAGGFAMALRTIPVMVEIAREIADINPSAWLINYANPTGLVAEGIKRTCPIQQISICDEPMILQEAVAAFLSIPPERIWLDYFGLNHLGFARKVMVGGNDVLPALRERLVNVSEQQVAAILGPEVMSDPKVRMELTNTLRILSDTSLLPSPYLQYFYFTEEITAMQRASGITRAMEVMSLERDLLTEYKKAAAEGRPLSIRRGGRWHADMMVGMLGAVANDARELYIVNVPNHGSMPELPYEKVVEVPCVVDASGAHPLAMGSMPIQVRGLIQSVAAYEELAVDAALTGSRERGVDALACHPLVGSRDLARRLLDAYLEAHKQYLPAFS